MVDRSRGAAVRDELVRLAIRLLSSARLLVFVTIRLARRLSRSTLIGGIAGLLLTLDGLAFVMSRTALLDIFQAFFLVAAVACCVADRDWYRERLAGLLDQRGLHDFAGEFGPVLAAAMADRRRCMFGAALGCKWNSIFVLAAFGVLRAVGRRREAPGRGRLALLAGLLIDGVPAFFRWLWCRCWSTWPPGPAGC